MRRHRICLLLFALVFVLGGSLTSEARAQSPYVYEPDLGGLVDVETGLVWGFSVFVYASDGGYTFQGAVNLAPGTYAASPWSYGYADWRVPTKTEMEQAFAKGIGVELDGWAVVMGAEPVGFSRCWTSTTAKVNGVNSAYAGSFANGTMYLLNQYSGLNVVLVRGAPPPQEPTKPGKRK